MKSKTARLLSLDNRSAHPQYTSFLRNLRIVFLPANKTSHLQPLDAGIIKKVKQLYGECIVRCFSAHLSWGEDPGKLTFISWESVTHGTVKNCFRKSRCSPEVEEPPTLA